MWNQGNAFEFSQLADARNDAIGVGNNVRGVFLGGGQNSPLTPQTDQISFVEHASLGRPTDFGMDSKCTPEELIKIMMTTQYFQKTDQI